MDIDEYRTKVHEYTYGLTYDIKDGKVDTNSFWFDFELGCPQAKSVTFDKSVNPAFDLSCFGIDEKGNFFSFNLDNYYEEGFISIRPYEGIKWFVQGFDRKSNQNFVTNMVDYYDNSYIIQILADIKSSNIQSVVEIDKNLLESANSIQINGTNDKGEEVSTWYIVPASPQLPSLVSFNTTFRVTDLNICGKYDCTHYVAIVSSAGGNTTWYKIKQQ